MFQFWRFQVEFDPCEDTHKVTNVHDNQKESYF